MENTTWSGPRGSRESRSWWFPKIKSYCCYFRIWLQYGGLRINLPRSLPSWFEAKVENFLAFLSSNINLKFQTFNPKQRHEECKHWDYSPQLPSVSVILVFHNEGWSTLVRTIHSVINFTPKHLLEEVVLIDDGSIKDHLVKEWFDWTFELNIWQCITCQTLDKGGRLEEHIKQWGGLVKLFHNERREGLIRARSIGARKSSGSVLVYLDAHCEVQPNWLPPLIQPMVHGKLFLNGLWCFLLKLQIIESQQFPWLMLLTVILMFSHLKLVAMKMDTHAVPGIGTCSGSESHWPNENELDKVMSPNRTDLPPWWVLKEKPSVYKSFRPAAFLQFHENSFSNWVCMMRGWTFGVVKISSWVIKFGCATVKCCLSLAPELATFIEWKAGVETVHHPMWKVFSENNRPILICFRKLCWP